MDTRVAVLYGTCGGPTAGRYPMRTTATKPTRTSKRAHFLWAVCLVATGGASFYGGYHFSHWESFEKSEYEVTCTRILDGDTIEVTGLLSDEPLKLRIVGVDTFETKRNKKLRQQALEFNLTEDKAYELGLYAKKTAERNLLNKTIRIEFSADHIEYDAFGRLLAYVFVQDLDFGRFLLENGLAYPRSEDHVRDKYYEWPTMQARSGKKGMYDTDS